MQSNIAEGGDGGGGSLMEEESSRWEEGEEMGGVWERMVRGGQRGGDVDCEDT
jgi:hypothetical protein